MKEHGGSTFRAPLILNLGTRWMCEVSFMPLSLNQLKLRQYHLTRSCCCSYRESNHYLSLVHTLAQSTIMTTVTRTVTFKL